MEDYERDLLDNYRNPEPVPYTAEQLAERIARDDNHHADYMWLLARAEKAEAELACFAADRDAMAEEKRMLSGD